MPVVGATVEIARSLTMPFIPVRPRQGDPIRTSSQIKSALADLDNEDVLIQPVLSGTRVCLAVVDRNVFIQNDRGEWVTTPPRNGHDFLKLPNNTCLDGYIAHNQFYAADCLAVKGQTLIYEPAAERETVAYQLTKLLHHRWLFQRPSKKFVRAAKANLPDFQGLTLKDYMGFYRIISDEKAQDKGWLRRTW